jgi:hypothetical protein
MTARKAVMDEVEHKALMEKWYEWRLKEKGYWGSGRDFALKLMRDRDQMFADERRMTMEQYLEYEYEGYCWDKWMESLSFREGHAAKLWLDGHTKEALYMFEALLADGYTTAHFPMNLAKTYRKLKRLDDEIRVLERGIIMTENAWKGLHPLDQCTNLKNVRVGLLKERLDKARGWKAKADAQKAKAEGRKK